MCLWLYESSYISTSGQTLFIEFPAAISCRQQYYIIIVSTPPPLFQRKEIMHLHAQSLNVYFFVWIDIKDWTNGWRGYNFIYKCKNWLKERWALYWLKHLRYYLVGFMSASSWKVVSVTGNMIGKRADQDVICETALHWISAASGKQADRFMRCEAYNNDSQFKPEVRLKKYY